MSGSADSHLVAPCTAGKPVELWSSGTRGGTGAPQLASLEGGDTTLLLKMDFPSSIQFNQKILLDLCIFQWRRNGRGREGVECENALLKPDVLSRQHQDIFITF